MENNYLVKEKGKFMNAVSVKGIVSIDGNFLLRQNERNEYELLGGKLEKSDSDLESRLKQEFLEESGIKVDVEKGLEPCFLSVNNKKILIVPYICKIKFIPDILFDEDGGKLFWINKAELENLNMPTSYLDSINQVSPRDSEIKINGTKHFYEDYQFSIFVRILNQNCEAIEIVEVENQILFEIKQKYEIKKNNKLVFNNCVVEGNNLYIDYSYKV